jgi:hypothetical protein
VKIGVGLKKKFRNRGWAVNDLLKIRVGILLLLIFLPPWY